MSKLKVLFILKRRLDYNAEKHSHVGLSTGLYNSVYFMNQMLNEIGIHSHMEVVTDNNDIDREVNKHKPTHVIIEALWVVPTKFNVLTKLHPKVKWIVRLHSELPFLASEGIALDWIGEYVSFKNVDIGINAPRALEEMRYFLSLKMGWCDEETRRRVIYMPNYYPQNYIHKDYVGDEKDTIDIGCFGAIRPLKNHIIQALAAVEFANHIKKKLNFYINTGKIEMKGEPILNNLKGLFTHLHHRGHRLVNNEWTPRDKFLQLCAKMDIGLQVSLSETFNIVAADLISQGVPVVGTTEIPWMNHMYCADPTETQEIYNTLKLVHEFPQLNVHANKHGLKHYTNKTKDIWENYFKHEQHEKEKS